MLQALQFKEIAKNNVQLCPLCAMPQEGFVNGIIVSGNEAKIQPDKFYSFCNCRNIFFTPWENMEQEVYDENYQAKYNGTVVSPGINNFAKKIFDSIPTKTGVFVEVGVVTDVILDMAKDFGMDPVALDINATTKTKYPLIVGSLDNVDLPSADVFWLSHVIEHVRNPENVMRRVFDALRPDGSVYVSMPDTWFIPWQRPQLWAHWHSKEHHILWDMDSFIDLMVEVGFKLHSSERRSNGCDFHVILRKASE
jgi:SAM-dependent methyltransferase